MLSQEQKAMLLKSQSFREQAGITPKSASTMAQNVNEDDIRTKLQAYMPTAQPVDPVAPKSTPATKKKANVADRIGNFLGEGVEDTVNTLAGLGVSGVNSVAALGALSQGKGYDMDKSRKVPGLGEVQPFLTGDETFGEGLGKVAIGGLEVAGAITGARELKDIKTGVKGFVQAVKPEVKKAAEVVSNIAAKKAEKAATKATQAVEEYLSPVLSKAERTKTLLKATGTVDPKTGKVIVEQGATKPGVFTKGKVVTDKFTKEMSKRVGNVVKMDDPTKDIIRLKNFVEEEGKIVAGAVKDNTGFVTRNVKQLKSDLAKLRESKGIKLMLGKDKTKESAWDTVMDVFDKSLKGKKITREGLYEVFQEFNKLSNEAKVYEGADNVTKEALKAVRDALRAEIIQGLPDDIARVVDQSLLNQFYGIKAQQAVADAGQKLVGAAGKVKSTVKKYGGIAATGLGTGGVGAGIISAINK